MKEMNINIDLFLPIQGRIRKGYDYVKKISQDLDSLWKVLLVPYNENYIVGDGHHTTLAYASRDLSKVPAIVVETDEDIRVSQRGAVKKFSSIRLFKEKYQKQWRPHCLARGIYSFEDYLN